MYPLKFVTRELITRAQQLIRETRRSLFEIGLDVGYKNPTISRRSSASSGRYADGVSE